MKKGLLIFLGIILSIVVFQTWPYNHSQPEVIFGLVEADHPVRTFGRSFNQTADAFESQERLEFYACGIEKMPGLCFFLTSREQVVAAMPYFEATNKGLYMVTHSLDRMGDLASFQEVTWVLTNQLSPALYPGQYKDFRAEINEMISQFEAGDLKQSKVVHFETLESVTHFLEYHPDTDQLQFSSYRFFGAEKLDKHRNLLKQFRNLTDPSKIDLKLG